MPQRLLSLFALFLFSTISFSQSFKSSMGIAGGITDDGFAGLATYNHYLNENDYVQGSLFAAFAHEDIKGINVPYRIFTFNAGYFHNIFSNRSGSTKIALGAGGVFGYEEINETDKILKNGILIIDESKFIYGGFVGAEADFFITDMISLIAKINQYYHSNSDVGELTIFAGVGLRIFVR